MSTQESWAGSTDREEWECDYGLQCPKCGNDEYFNVSAHSWFEIDRWGTKDFQDVEWGDDDQIFCLVCSQQGTVREFTREEN